MEAGDVEALETHLVDVVDMHIKADLLASAIKLGRMECISCLLGFGADPFLKQSDTRRTALYWSVLKDDVDALRLLLRDIHRDPIDVVFESSSLANDTAEKCHVERGASSLQVRHGHLPNTQARRSPVFDLSYRTKRAMDEALFEAASLGSIETARFLIKNGANPNISCYHDDEFLSWCTPLIAACFVPLNGFCKRTHQEAENMVKLLVEYGADVCAKNYIGDTAMHWAAACGLREAIHILLRNGADINAQNQLGSTPIMIAIERNNGHAYETVLMLLEWGANVNDVDRSGWSVLCYAVNSSDISVTELLLDRGAQTNYDCDLGKHVVVTTNPLFIATTLGNRPLIQLLISYGADVNRKAGSTTNPVSPFASCLEMGNFELAKYFLEVGANHNDAFNSVESCIQKLLGGSLQMRDYLKPTDQMKLSSLETFKNNLSTPMTLMNLCRVVIHSCVLQKNIKLLPIPTAIKSFLCFD